MGTILIYWRWNLKEYYKCVQADIMKKVISAAKTLENGNTVGENRVIGK